ncbi:MAG: RNA 2'-phosphotransferase [Saezia sp.]
MKQEHQKISKFLSFVLRHQPQAIGICLDSDGWVNIDELLRATHQHGHPIERDTLQTVVDSNDKKRFTISEDALRIRAAQGHSTQQVEMHYAAVEPPEVLYHGTATRFLASIKKQGLIPGSRHYVHLSADEETARHVGVRHGFPVILKINARCMWQDDYVFHQADNGVWLTKSVPVHYLEQQ